MKSEDLNGSPMLSMSEAIIYMESRGIKRSQSWLRNAEKQKLISSKLTEGGHRRYSRDDIDELVTNGEVKRYVLVLTTPTNDLFLNSDSGQKKWIKANTNLIPKLASIRADSLTNLTTDLISALSGRNISAAVIQTTSLSNSKFLAIAQQLLTENQCAVIYL